MRIKSKKAKDLRRYLLFIVVTVGLLALLPIIKEKQTLSSSASELYKRDPIGNCRRGVIKIIWRDLDAQNRNDPSWCHWLFGNDYWSGIEVTCADGVVHATGFGTKRGDPNDCKPSLHWKLKAQEMCKNTKNLDCRM